MPGLELKLTELRRVSTDIGMFGDGEVTRRTRARLGSPWLVKGVTGGLGDCKDDAGKRLRRGVPRGGICMGTEVI